jgi:hypothetical protein
MKTIYNITPEGKSTHVGLLTLEQCEIITGVRFTVDSFFNPIQDNKDNWVVSIEEMEQCTNQYVMWVKDLPLIEYVPKPFIEPEPVIEVQAWQLWIVLDEMALPDSTTTLLEFVDSMIDTMVDPVLKRRAKIARENVNTIRTDSPFIQLMAHDMHLSKEEVNQIFEAANNIEL